MNKTIEERAKELYPNCDPADKLYSALIEDLRAAYIAGVTENISGSTSTNTQVRTICAKELRGEAGCKEVCDECKRKMQEATVSTEAEGWTRVEDGLPDTRTVIILTEYGVVTVGWYAGSVGDNSWKGDFIGKVTHWRPIPAPPTVNK